MTYILVYVDDFIITGSDSSELSSLITLLNKKFALKDLGALHFFLGILVDRLPGNKLLLRQTKYIEDLLHKVNIASAKPQQTPIAASLKLLKDGSPQFAKPKLYRSIVGALQYVCTTRPEIAFSVNKVSQFM